jgi:hypothetical protein
VSYATSADPVRTCQMTIGIRTNLATVCMAPNLAVTGGRLPKIGLLLCEELHGHLQGLTRAELRAVLGLGMSGSEPRSLESRRGQDFWVGLGMRVRTAIVVIYGLAAESAHALVSPSRKRANPRTVML